MQTICTSPRTDNHTITSSLDFYRPHTLPDARQFKSSKSKALLLFTEVFSSRYRTRSLLFADFHSSFIHTYIHKGSPYSITERRVPELIPVLGSQPAGDMSQHPQHSSFTGRTLFLTPDQQCRSTEGEAVRPDNGRAIG